MRQAADNKRAHRLHHELPVAYRSVGSFLTDWATNISQGGLFINTRKPLPVGTEVKILIQLPGAAFPFQLHGQRRPRHRVRQRGQHGPGHGRSSSSASTTRGAREIDEFVTRLRREFGEG